MAAHGAASLCSPPPVQGLSDCLEWGSAMRCLREIFLPGCHLFGVQFYSRRLPHWHPPDADFFVTWRLYGSLPKSREPVLSPAPAGEAFRALDQELDRATKGPLWLKDPRIAECVSHVLLCGVSQWRLYALFAWVVMANHVHVLLRPRVPLSKALMNVKSGTARAANVLLGRTGQHFWQDESFDHWVRSDAERDAIIRYIHNNPVTAGLVERPEEWRWSSAGWQRTALPHISPYDFRAPFCGLFRRVWRILAFLRLGLVMLNVPLP
jgi:putative transposase